MQSTIPKGRIIAIDVDPIGRMLGVLLVMTRLNAPRLPKQKQGAQSGKKDVQAQSKPDQKQQSPNPKLSLLQHDRVDYNAQPIAVVVADSIERARDAARRLRVGYAEAPAQLDFDQVKQRLRRLNRSPSSRPIPEEAMPCAA